MALDLNDKTANGNNLTNSSATDETVNLPSYVTGLTHVAKLGTTQQHFQVTNNFVGEPTSAVSVQFDVNFNSLPGLNLQPTMIGSWFGTNVNEWLVVFRNDAGVNKFRFFVTDGVNTENFDYNFTPTTNTWYNMAFTWQGSDKSWVVYKDAVSVASGTGATVASLVSTAQKPFIGPPATGDVTDIWIGNIRVSNTKIASGTVSSRRTTLSTGSESDLVAYWPFQALPATGSTASTLMMMGVGN